ncbi:MAG: 3-hydroxyacyl-CoA dehydrogenase, partial [Bacteroidetes bacterium]|nr:3-hydroxyacyl-CoA dehydrogenase [Bacteroidota bacterium]
RIGVFSILLVFKLMQELGLTVEEIDTMTGPVSGRPKSATFRTCDVVGIDTLVKVADNLYQDCPDDESREFYQVPEFIRTMINNGWIGDKGGQGFYKKVKENGKSEILALNVNTLEYSPQNKTRFDSIGKAKQSDDLKERIRILYSAKDKVGEFTRAFYNRLFAYATHRVPEIADETYKIDEALKAGFGWEIGVFEAWDALGTEQVTAELSKQEYSTNNWLAENSELKSFYTVKDQTRKFFNQKTGQYEAIPGSSNYIILETLKPKKVVWQNAGCSIIDIGDDVLCVEFHSKMNTMGGEVIQGINKGIELAEKNYAGVVIGNDGQNFSAGANLGMIFMFAVEQEWDELNFAISAFQKTMMRARYSSIPVVAATFNLALGGGCELSLHADAVQASAETYIGLVEFGAGVIPGGGGTKEFALRASDSYYNGDPELPLLNERFMTIATAKVATSAHEAFDLGILQKGKDRITMNRQRLLSDAKERVLELANAGYTQPSQRTDIKVLGRSALGGLLAGAYAMQQANYITEYDLHIAQKLAHVICGGDLSYPQLVSEQYLLNLEREAFLSLLGERKTLERIQSLIKTGKPLRN